MDSRARPDSVGDCGARAAGLHHPLAVMHGKLLRGAAIAGTGRSSGKHDLLASPRFMALMGTASPSPQTVNVTSNSAACVLWFGITMARCS